ncbi:MAG: GrpB family protein [Pseudomonadota bacterium]
MSLLSPPDHSWPAQAEAAIDNLTKTLGPVLLACHHIGSTSVPGLPAKPILDLLPVVTDHATLDAHSNALLALGYEALGPFGLPGRRYFRNSAADGTRLIHAHAYEAGHPDIIRHLAFRDLLRQEPDLRHSYAEIKREADAQAGGDMARYMEYKDAFIKTHEARAVAMGLGT